MAGMPEMRSNFRHMDRPVCRYAGPPVLPAPAGTSTSLGSEMQEQFLTARDGVNAENAGAVPVMRRVCTCQTLAQRSKLLLVAPPLSQRAEWIGSRTCALLNVLTAVLLRVRVDASDS